jgi:hypothetical protein
MGQTRHGRRRRGLCVVRPMSPTYHGLMSSGGRTTASLARVLSIPSVTTTEDDCLLLTVITSTGASAFETPDRFWGMDLSVAKVGDNPLVSNPTQRARGESGAVHSRGDPDLRLCNWPTKRCAFADLEHRHQEQGRWCKTHWHRQSSNSRFRLLRRQHLLDGCDSPYQPVHHPRDHRRADDLCARDHQQCRSSPRTDYQQPADSFLVSPNKNYPANCHDWRVGCALGLARDHRLHGGPVGAVFATQQCSLQTLWQASTTTSRTALEIGLSIGL